MPEAKKIIMLEDEEVLGRMYCRALEGAGFKVKLCQEAEDLVKEYEAFEPHLAFLDHALHGEERRGMQLIETLRSSIPNLIIVMLS
ncbi:MAG: response regulator, partial [Candidatus Peregrinibacteria bacterium]|nr:response regulator [Candidatus Peregrinibacteria bacterium]